MESPQKKIVTTSVGIYSKAIDSMQKTKSMMKDSPLTVLGLSLKQTPKMAETVEQSKILCEDYIYSRLSGLVVDHDVPHEPPAVTPTITDVSREIQLIGARLEATYPTLYQNISRQVNLPLKSEVAVRKALVSVGDYMFKHSVVTWGRIVALFAIASGIANECLQNGHPELIWSIVTLFSELVEKHAAAWICKQGGWLDITKAFRVNKATRDLWALTGLGAVFGFFFTWFTTSQI